MGINALSCCGVREITNLHGSTTPELALKKFCVGAGIDKSYGPRFRHAIFTEAGTRSKYGKNFKAFIMDNNLGEVAQSVSKRNPNSGRNVIVYVWTIDFDAIRKWASDNITATDRNRLFYAY